MVNELKKHYSVDFYDDFYDGEYDFETKADLVISIMITSNSKVFFMEMIL